MKKILLVIFLVLVLCGCSIKKSNVSTKEFCETFTKKNGYCYSNMDEYSDNENVLDCYSGSNSKEEFTIIYYKFDSIDYAKSVFNDFKYGFIKYKSSKYNENQINLLNYNYYSIVNNGYYKVTSRIDDTVIYIDAEEKYIDKINKYLKELGYL